jgi:hypothetical protein
MPGITKLDKQWQQLMALCESESKQRGDPSRLVGHVASEIEQLARGMGSAHVESPAVTSSGT